MKTILWGAYKERRMYVRMRVVTAVCGVLLAVGAPGATRGAQTEQMQSAAEPQVTRSVTVIATVPVGTDPEAVAVNQKTDRIYVTNVISNTVSVIDGETNDVVTTIPVGVGPFPVAINQETNRIYVGNTGVGGISDNTVSVIDGETNDVVTTIPVGVSPIAVAINQKTNRI